MDCFVWGVFLPVMKIGVIFICQLSGTKQYSSWGSSIVVVEKVCSSGVLWFVLSKVFPVVPRELSLVLFVHVLFHYVCAPCACNEYPSRSEEGIHQVRLEVVDGFTLWVLETKPRSFGREDNALSRWTIIPDLALYVWKVIQRKRLVITESKFKL